MKSINVFVWFAVLFFSFQTPNQQIVVSGVVKNRDTKALMPFQKVYLKKIENDAQASPSLEANGRKYYLRPGYQDSFWTDKNASFQFNLIRPFRYMILVKDEELLQEPVHIFTSIENRDSVFVELEVYLPK